MSGKTHMSDKTKKILTGVGIGFGTVMVFLVSFILAFSLIINPINFFTVSDAGTVEENEKLKEEVQTLNDKYKAAANAPQPSAPAIVTTPSTNTNTNTGTDTAGGQSTEKPEVSAPAQTTETTDSGQENGTADSGFSPDVVDSTAEQTPEDVEAPITVIDISE